MGNTKKVKSTGRFGARYGVGIKKRVLKVEEKQRNLSACPFCGFKKIKRIAAGLFICKKCEAKFTGGAYESETLVGKTIKKMVNQKSFVADSAELIKASEKASESSYSEIEKEVAKSMGVEDAKPKAKKVIKKKAKKEEKESEEDKTKEEKITTKAKTPKKKKVKEEEVVEEKE
jgi:large subunit ribosomal protein L37Ae